MNQKYIDTIVEQTDLTVEEIKEKVDAKLERLGNLIPLDLIYRFVMDDLGLTIPENDSNNNPKKKEKKKIEESKMGNNEIDVKSDKKTLSKIDIEKKMALTVRDENEALPVMNGAFSRIHYPSEEEILFLIKRRKFVKEKLIDDTDKMKIGGQLFLKKSAWRKYINAFGISIEVIFLEVAPIEDDVIATCRVKAIAPNGQSVVAEGTKAKSEYWSDKYKNYGSYTLHNLKATARTRAINIAVSDLVGYGETSAEELMQEGQEDK